MIYELDNIFLIRKNQWIPTSIWPKENFLEKMQNKKFFIEQYIQNINIKNIKHYNYFINNQTKNFWIEKEYWLLNRLDNWTSWFLYFAKNINYYNYFKKNQKENKIKKIYYWDVLWEIKDKKIIINYPIWHSKKNNKKMICIKKNIDKKKIRGDELLSETIIEKIYFDKEKNTTLCKFTITKWIRHQIRIHCSSIWHPIIWDNLYWNDTNTKNPKYNLRSIWLIL